MIKWSHYKQRLYQKLVDLDIFFELYSYTSIFLIREKTFYKFSLHIQILNITTSFGTIC